MLYTIPDYYKEFHCVADQCEDTCCAGWQIVIDQRSLKRYKKVSKEKPFGRELKKGIHWKEGIFHQDKEKRCVFLDDENLCRLYSNLGGKSLCKTCRLYPRHVEEFEGVREISLSVSCPVVAKMLMERKTPVTFRSYEKEGEETYEEFDPFLFSILQDAREAMIYILQNRELEMKVREALVLGMAHDMQRRVNQGEMFSCMDVMECYQTEAAVQFARSYLLEHPVKETPEELFRHLFELELLRQDWERLLLETETLLYGRGTQNYWKEKEAFELWKKDKMPDWDVHIEQLWVYFLFTYFPGAVYDGAVFAKARFALSMVRLTQELWLARWIKNGGTLSVEEMTELLYRFSREVEHSDENLKKMESYK